ncbi:unnamed protein product [Didymodactylos carnosus]|uniref:Uncharacterized protein n=1 Tax=Didymodactylos carnosus TaxID=1234261 RepID=A0A816A3X0_9BILA|nr:unnamed protein product [Didymodactylos carnosus]CAF1590123.1 unnamed protein product [Didymodactylos carnosus]CAF3498932.1 unnamed protein product [Didymodactylos carnosus]CAF4461657.1 unnamed protein product [Didymodactylos carnosus]
MNASMPVSGIESENDAAIQAFVDIFERKNQDDVISDSIPHHFLRQLAGHVTDGSKREDFLYLQKGTPVKKFAWVMGDDGLMLFLTQSNLQALHSLGYEDKWIRRKLKDGECFRLCLFPRSDECVPGTWDNVFSLVDKHYPTTISKKLQRHADALKQMSFDDIETRARLSYLAGISYTDVRALAVDRVSTDPRYMSEERYAECEGTLEQSRGFLYHRLGLLRLYDGSGFTKDMHGRLIVREYLQPNMLVEDIVGFRYIDLPIDSTDLMPDA